MTAPGTIVVVRAVAPPAPTLLAGPITLDGDVTVDAPGTSILFGATVSSPTIRQLDWTGTGPNDGHRMTLRAQDGRAVASGANRAGGSIGLEPGAGGTGGTGTGAPGGVEIGAANEVGGFGVLRLKNPAAVYGGGLLVSRNAANNADLPILSLDGSDVVSLGDDTQTSTAIVRGHDTASLWAGGLPMVQAFPHATRIGNANHAAAGLIRTPNMGAVPLLAARNGTNDGDVPIATLDGSNRLYLGDGTTLVTRLDSGASHLSISGTGAETDVAAGAHTWLVNGAEVATLDGDGFEVAYPTGGGATLLSARSSGGFLASNDGNAMTWDNTGVNISPPGVGIITTFNATGLHAPQQEKSAQVTADITLTATTLTELPSDASTGKVRTAAMQLLGNPVEITFSVCGLVTQVSNVMHTDFFVQYSTNAGSTWTQLPGGCQIVATNGYGSSASFQTTFSSYLTGSYLWRVVYQQAGTGAGTGNTQIRPVTQAEGARLRVREIVS